MFLRNFKEIFLICFILTGCTYRNQVNEMHSVDEFVMDSYKINEGKTSILEMQGKKINKITKKDFVRKIDYIKEGDLLTLRLYHPKRKDLVNYTNEISENIGYRVKNGKISIENLDDVFIIALSLEDARDKIKKRYQKEIKDIRVFLDFKEKKISKIDVIGLVHGSFEINEKTYLFDILSNVGIPPTANLFESYILRDEKQISVDFYKLLKMGDMSQNIIMKPNDKIYVASSSTSKLLVIGEVNKQSIIDLPNGSISIKEALIKVGGISLSGDKSYIQVIRVGAKDPKIYLLTWRQIINLPARALLLMPGDIVYVASTPISDWNKFVSQILPSFAIYDAAFHRFKSLGIIIDAK